MNGVLKADATLLLLIDLQARLMPAISDQDRVTERCHWLLRLARELGIPTMATVHNPDGLGELVEPIKSGISPADQLTKHSFDASCDNGIKTRIAAQNKPMVLIAGVEAHVCVLQTALGLVNQGYRTFVAWDAVGSRRQSDRELARQRLGSEGVSCLSSEMVFFEWLEDSSHSDFKRRLREFVTA